VIKNCVRYCRICFKIELKGTTIHTVESWNEDIKFLCVIFCLFNEMEEIKNINVVIPSHCCMLSAVMDCTLAHLAKYTLFRQKNVVGELTRSFLFTG